MGCLKLAYQQAGEVKKTNCIRQTKRQSDYQFHITSAYAQSSNASTTGFERLFLEDVLVPMEGYMFIYVSNQEEQANIAYFDDITIEHKHSPVLQADDYYPFCLSF